MAQPNKASGPQKENSSGGVVAKRRERASERARFTSSGKEDERASVVCTCTLTAVNF